MFSYVRLVVAASFAAVLLCIQTALANNNFASATLLTGSSGQVVGNNSAATGEFSENTTYGGGAMNSIWYKWVAPSTGIFTASTCNLNSETTTSFDTTLILYTGTNFPLTVRSTNDDADGCSSTANGSYASVVSFNVTTGTTYYLQVDGFGDSVGNFVLRYGIASLTVAAVDNVATEGSATATASFTVVLNSPPASASPGGNNMPTQSATVTIGASGQCGFAPTSLTFTGSNWNTPQTVVVTGTEDVVIEGTHSCSPASITAATGAYAGITATPPTITLNDNDNPLFSIAKSANVSSINAPGTITYTIIIDNTGSALLTGPVITDALLLGASSRTLTSGPTLISGDTNSNNQIEDTETWTYQATYAVPQSDMDLGGTFSNTATFDTSETAALSSTAATTSITQTPSFTVAKALSGGPSPVTAGGQTLNYTISAANTGNVSLTGLSIADSFQLGGVSRTLTSAPAYSSGDSNSDGKISVGETWVYAATYLVPQSDMDATGSFTNVADFTTTQAGTKTSNIVTTPVTRLPTLAIAKSWAFALPAHDLNSNGIADVNDLVTYYYAVTNTGNVTTSSVSVADSHLGAGTPPVPASELLFVDTAPLGDSTDATSNDGLWTTLRPADTIRFSGTYLVTQTDIDNQ